MQLEAVSATVLMRGALKKNILSEEKDNAANTRKKTSGTTTPVRTAASSTTKYYVRDVRCPYCLIRAG